MGDLKIADAALAEMTEAFRVFRPYRSVRKVTMFGSARTLPDDPVYVLARDLAARMAEAGWMVVTGAGPGIMAAGTEGAGRDHAFGVNIRLPHEEGANPFIAQDPKLVEMRYFFTRKLMLIKESDGYAVLPGGFGTQDECYELLTLLQTGKAEPAPVVLVETPGRHLLARLAALLGRGGHRARAGSRPRTSRCSGWPTRSRRRPTRCSASTATTTRAAGWATCWCCACRWPPAGPSWPTSTGASPTSWSSGTIRAAVALPARAVRQRPPRAAPGGLPLRPVPLRPAAPAHRRPQRVHRRGIRLSHQA